MQDSEYHCGGRFGESKYPDFGYGNDKYNPYEDCYYCGKSIHEDDQIMHEIEDHRHVKHKYANFCPDCCEVWPTQDTYNAHRHNVHGKEDNGISYAEHPAHYKYIAGRPDTECQFCDFRGRAASDVCEHERDYHTHTARPGLSVYSRLPMQDGGIHKKKST